MSWWYYATNTERALVIIGLVALALLVVIIMSPYVKPLRMITAGLGLVRTEVIYVPVNHTVAKYVYVNRTVYITVPGNTSIPLDMGTCHLYSLVFSNGTVWTLGYWMPTPQAWRLYVGGKALIAWGGLDEYAGVKYVVTLPVVVIQPGSAGLVLLPLMVYVPYEAPPGWVGVVYMGDWLGVGPVVFRGGVVNDSLVLPQINGTPPLTIPLNTTVTVFIEPLTRPFIPLILPCNWTVIRTPLTPGQALALPAPMGVLIAEEANYIEYGRYGYAPYMPTWGFWVWGAKYSMRNATNLPWPVG